MQVSLTNILPSGSGSFEASVTGWVAGQNNTAIPLSIARVALSPTHGETGSWMGQVSGNVNFSAQSGVQKAACQLNNVTVVSGRKYYIRAQARIATPVTSNSAQFSNNGADIGHSFVTIGNSSWGLIDYIWTANTVTLGLRIQFSAEGLSGNTATSFQVDNVMVIDLTAAFGAGNEPTAAAMRESVYNYAQRGYWDGSTAINFPEPPEIDVTVTMINGLFGRSFSHQVNIVQNTGIAPFIFSLSGLPAGHGLLINSSGQITGTLELREGSYPFTVTVMDAVGFTDTASFTLNVGEPPVILDTYIPGAIYNEPYSFTFHIEGSDPVTTSIFAASGSLPTGLLINNDTWTISGTPSVDGQSCLITVIAYNSYDNTGNVLRTFDFSVASKAHIDTTSPLPFGIVGQAYQSSESGFHFSASGVQPITWTLLSGNVPAGMSFNAATAVLSGTPTTTGVHSFSLRAENELGYSDRIFDIMIYQLPDITTTNLGYARLDVPYSASISATGSTPITWTIVSGNLPSGLSINPSTGTITGTPLATGMFNFTVQATNIAGSVTKAFSIQAGTALGITTTSPLRIATRNVAYGNLQFVAAGVDIFYTQVWSNPGGGLPTGMTFSASGVLSGTPTVAGTYTFNIRITNGSNISESPFILIVGDVPAVNQPHSLNGGADRPFTTVLTATSTVAVTWTMTSSPSPAPPQGYQLTLSSAGVLSWLIPVTGVYTFNVVATNQFGNSVTTQFTLTITTPSINDVFPPDDSQVLSPQIYLIVGTQSSNLVSNFLPYTFAATGDPPLTWTLMSPTGGLAAGETAGLPTGTSFNAATGVLSGTPTTAGRFKFDLQVSNIPANSHARETFWINVVSPPSIITTALNSGNSGTAYSQALQATGTTPVIWTILPVGNGETGLPSGTSLSGSMISGTPTMPGTYIFTARAQNIAGLNYVDERQFTIQINLPYSPIITTGANLTGVKGTAYSLQLAAQNTGSQFAPVAWSVDSGSTLPNNLTLTSGGLLAGTPTVHGTFQFKINVTNSDGSDSRVFIMVISDPATITTLSLPNGTKGEYYSETIIATGDAPVTFDIRPLTGGETGLPFGTTLNTNIGVISGIPTTPGVYTFRIRAINSFGSSTVAFSIKIVDNEIIGTAINGKKVGGFSYNSGTGAKLVGGLALGGNLVFKNI